MSRLTWDATGERYFENGVDRGVLYVGATPGVAWTGLVSVAEAPSGGEPRAFYQDGLKYLQVSSKEEYVATISAFTAPKEFGVCDGMASIQNGLFVTNQPRKPFGFTYRTRVGNDVDGTEHGYKIHLVYNAMAAPTSRNNATLSADVAPETLAWQISTIPPTLTGKKPTAHFVIDSRYTPRGLLASIEDILYGSASFTPRLPSVSELTDLFQSQGPITRRNLVLNPGATAAAQWGASIPGATIAETMIAAGVDGPILPDGTIAAYARYTTSVVAPPVNSYALTGTSVAQGWGTLPAGAPVMTSIYVRSSTSQNVTARSFRYLNGAFAGTIQLGPVVSLPANEWVRLVHMSNLEAPANSIRAAVVLSSVGTLGQVLDVTSAVVEEGTEDLGYFSGDTADGNGYFYAWSSTPGLSVSELRTWN